MHEAITGVVLAGGLGRRMGGVDKGLQALRGVPLLQHVLDRLRPQVDAVIINANRNLDRYRMFGHLVLPDLIPDFAGPLAGLHAGLSRATTPLVLTVPCDSPYFPIDLVARLEMAMQMHGSVLAFARTGEQRHPVFCLARHSALPQLADYLESGGRRMDGWVGSLAFSEVDFVGDAFAFTNINTLDDLASGNVSPTSV